MTAPNITTATADAHSEIAALRGELRDLERRARTAPLHDALAMHMRAVDITARLTELRVAVGAL